AVCALHQLAGVAKRIIDFAGDKQLELQRFFDGCQNFGLGAGGGDFAVLEQAYDRHSGINRMEERAVCVVGAPVVGVLANDGEAAEEMARSAVGGGAVGGVSGGLE